MTIEFLLKEPRARAWRLRGLLIASLMLMVSSAGATTITYSTDGAITGFNGGMNNTLNSTSGAAATLTYIDDVNISTGVPSNVNFGNFTLVCASCTTQAGGLGSFFDAFTFSLMITDVTDNATGIFTGTSTGGNLFQDVSQITVTWSPLQLGPGISDALSGDFGSTIFTTTDFTAIVAPNSGAVPGQSTVQGHVDSNAVPEPTMLVLAGCALLVLAVSRRRSLSRR